MNNNNTYLPQNIVNLITDYNQCACGWSCESDLSHAEFSVKDCENINYYHERCFDCKDDIVEENSYINVKIRCQDCHIKSITESSINYREYKIMVYQMVGFQYYVYLNENNEQIKVCKFNGYQEEDLNDVLYELKTDADQFILESEIPEGLEHLFKISTV